MPKTRKNKKTSYKNKSKKMMCKNEATFHGLHEWYRAMFEK